MADNYKTRQQELADKLAPFVIEHGLHDLTFRKAAAAVDMPLASLVHYAPSARHLITIASIGTLSHFGIHWPVNGTRTFNFPVNGPLESAAVLQVVAWLTRIQETHPEIIEQCTNERTS